MGVEISSTDAVRIFGRDTAEYYAELVAVLARRGKMIPQSDPAVAATALSLGHRVLVGLADEKHFRMVPGLELVVPG